MFSCLSKIIDGLSLVLVVLGIVLVVGTLLVL